MMIEIYLFGGDLGDTITIEELENYGLTAEYGSDEGGNSLKAEWPSLPTAQRLKIAVVGSADFHDFLSWYFKREMCVTDNIKYHLTGDGALKGYGSDKPDMIFVADDLPDMTWVQFIKTVKDAEKREKAGATA